MKINLTQDEIDLIRAKKIEFDVQHNYSNDEALELLERVRDMEIFYAQSPESEMLYYKYGDLADKIQSTIQD